MLLDDRILAVGHNEGIIQLPQIANVVFAISLCGFDYDSGLARHLAAHCWPQLEIIDRKPGTVLSFDCGDFCYHAAVCYERSWCATIELANSFASGLAHILDTSLPLNPEEPISLVLNPFDRDGLPHLDMLRKTFNSCRRRMLWLIR
jgi:hypothetical protein